MVLLPMSTLGYPTFSWFLPIIYGSIGAIPALLTLFFDLDKTADSLKAAADDPPNVYDFIVGKNFIQFKTLSILHYRIPPGLENRLSDM